MTTRHNLKQVVSKLARNGSILDLILTDFHKLYNDPEILTPLGSSDHNLVKWSPRPACSGTNKASKNKNNKILIRRYPRGVLNAFGRWASSQDWFANVEPDSSADTLAEHFTLQVLNAIDLYFPLKQIKVHETDKPWLTPYIQDLVKQRQKVFSSSNT